MRSLSVWCLAVVVGAGMLMGVVVAQETGSTSGSTTTQSTGQAGQSSTSPGTASPAPSSQSPTTDQSAGQSTFPGSTGETQVLIDPGKIYNDRTPTEWVGKSVQLQNVMVTDTNDSGNFWVGVGGKQRLLIVKRPDDPNEQALRIHKGDIVNISGVVEPATDEWAQKTKAEMGSMHDAHGGAGVFLFASNVSIASSTSKK